MSYTFKHNHNNWKRKINTRAIYVGRNQSLRDKIYKPKLYKQTKEKYQYKIRKQTSYDLKTSISKPSKLIGIKSLSRQT